MNTSVFEQHESNVRSYCRNFPTVFIKAKGAIMTDETGRDFVDFFAGAGALNYGHNPDRITERLISYLQQDGIIHSMDMYTAPKREFLEYFTENILKPRGYDYKVQFTGPTGTNAVEAAIKLARIAKKRQNVFAFMGAFHGMTLGALSLTTDRCSREGAGQNMQNVTHIPAPYMFPELDTIAYMECLLNDDHSGVEKPAAIILETVQADGGIYAFDAQWLRDLRDLCTKHDILLIADDIQVGCGRAGTFFSFERADIQPDEDLTIVGFRSQFSMIYGDNSENYFLKVIRGDGINRESKLEGMRRNNLICTHIIGPILSLNPLFCEYLLSLCGEKAEAAFKETAMSAYLQRVKEFSDPAVIFGNNK